jgi:hypothetical protein
MRSACGCRQERIVCASKCSSVSRKQLSLRMSGFWSLLLLVFIACGLMSYQLWPHSQTLPLPGAVDIRSVEFGINLGFASTTWHALPFPTGDALVDFFRDSIATAPRQDPNLFVEIAPPEYSVRIIDKKGEDYCLWFRVYSNDVYVPGVWTKDSFYVFPENRIPKLKKLVQGVLSSKQVAGGTYCYLPGEDDRSHYSRICSLILSGNSKNLRPQTPSPDHPNKSPEPPANGGPVKH